MPHTPRDAYLVIRAQGVGEATAAGTTRHPGRAPRRIDAELSDPLLDLCTVVAARAVTAAAGERSLATELVARCDCLVLVSDGRTPYQPAELDLLHAATAARKMIFLAVTHADESGDWPDVVMANQSKLARNFSELAMRSWYVVSRGRSGVPDLRRALSAWAVRARASRTTAPAIRLASDAATSAWRRVLHEEVEAAHARVAASAEAALTQLEPTAQASVERLEQGLQALSRQLHQQLEATTHKIIADVLACVVAQPPDPPTLARVHKVLRRDIAERTAGLPECYRALRVTRSAAVAVTSSRNPVTALAAHTEPSSCVLPPLGIGLTTNCVALLHHQPANWPARAWVQRALSAVRIELAGELAQQFGHLNQAVAGLIAQAIDHDLLLA